MIFLIKFILNQFKLNNQLKQIVMDKFEFFFFLSQALSSVL